MSIDENHKMLSIVDYSPIFNSTNTLLFISPIFNSTNTLLFISADEDNSDLASDADMDSEFKPDRRAYLLTDEQMQMHGYPFEKTKEMISLNATETLEKDSPMFSIDCEMVSCR